MSESQYIVVSQYDNAFIELKNAILDEELKKYDNLRIPNAVVNMFFDEKCSLIKAWRVYLKKTQKEVADALGIGQSAFAQIEKSKKCHKATLERIAAVLGLQPGQLTLDD